MSGEPLIAAERLSLSYGRHKVLEGVDLAVRRGEIVTVIGPNGAGKTTLLKVALGLIAPDSGRVVRSAPLRLGYMPQRLALPDTLPLTVRRFLAMAGPASAAEFGAVLAEVRAERVLENAMTDLSGGELQRVLLARALLRRPDLLVLDEPVRGVDVVGQAEFYELIARLRGERNLGILMVSHDLHLVMRATDEVLCLNGHVCCHGHPESVSRHPEFVALFGDRVAAALAVYTHHHDHRHG
jgi:zinc transport system ATP-binding protein